jgi:hypothetical protein
LAKATETTGLKISVTLSTILPKRVRIFTPKSDRRRIMPNIIMMVFLDQSPIDPEEEDIGEARVGDEFSIKIYYTGRFLRSIRSVLLFLI